MNKPPSAKSNMLYFNRFFNCLPFFAALENSYVDTHDRVYVWLKHPSNRVFQEEIDKWLGVAYKYNAENIFKRKLAGKVDYGVLLGFLYELMAAYFLDHMLGFRLTEYEPSSGTGKYGDWLCRKDDQDVYVEVKSKWENRDAEGMIDRSYDQLLQAFTDAHEQKPLGRIPFIVFITDDLTFSPAYDNTELMNVLYGTVGQRFRCNRTGQFEHIGSSVTKKGFFSKRRRPGLSAVSTLKLHVFPRERSLANGSVTYIDERKYHCRIYHNPSCNAKCRVNQNWFRKYEQYLSHTRKVEPY